MDLFILECEERLWSWQVVMSLVLDNLAVCNPRSWATSGDELALEVGVQHAMKQGESVRIERVDRSGALKFGSRNLGDSSLVATCLGGELREQHFCVVAADEGAGCLPASSG